MKKLKEFVLLLSLFLAARLVALLLYAWYVGGTVMFLLSPARWLIVQTLVEELVVVTIPAILTYVIARALLREVFPRLLMFTVLTIFALMHIPYYERLVSVVLDPVIALCTRNVYCVLAAHLIVHLLWNALVPVIIPRA